jgi:hypothetical protein
MRPRPISAIREISFTCFWLFAVIGFAQGATSSERRFQLSDRGFLVLSVPPAWREQVRNPIESTFATIRHRTDRTKGCVSRSTLLGMVYRLGMSAQTRWRRLRGFERLGELIAGVKFVDGVRAQARTKQIRSVQQAAA